MSDIVTTGGRTYHDCYKWYALDAMRTWAARRPDSGSCFISGNQCGQDPTSSEDLQYMGEDVAYAGMAYSIMRSLMTQQERDTFMAYQLNGSLPPSPTHAGCVNRIPDRPAYTGKFTFDAEDKYTCTGKYGTTKTPFTAVWTGEPLPSSLVGKNIFFHQKSGLSTFTNQTQVTIATPGYTAARVHCWDSAGTKITPSSSAFAANLTTVTFSALQSGTCTANIKMATRNGSFGVVLSVNPSAGTFTFDSCSARSGMENQLYLVSDAGPQSCGYAFNSVHYGNAPAYVAGQANTSLSSPVLPWDTTISVADASGFPTVFPFYVAIGDDNDKEMLKVTNTSGYTLTVERGVYETVARGWPSGSPIFWKYTSHITDNNGWNNRNVTKQQGFMSQALAFAQDSQYARDLLAAATQFWYANTYVAGHKYYGLITNALIAYGVSRQMHNWSPMVQMLYTATNGAVDYRDTWMSKGMALFYPYLSLPWDPDRFMIMGQTADNCKSLTGSAEGNCFEPIIHAQEFLRGTTRSTVRMEVCPRFRPNHRHQRPQIEQSRMFCLSSYSLTAPRPGRIGGPRFRPISSRHSQATMQPIQAPISRWLSRKHRGGRRPRTPR